MRICNFVNFLILWLVEVSSEFCFFSWCNIMIIKSLIYFDWNLNLDKNLATDSCRDGWNLRNCSSSHVQVFRDRWNVEIGDGWNVRFFLNMNFLKLVKIWIWILQNLRCLSCKSTNFVLVVKPTLMSLFWLFGLCLFGLLFAMYDW